MSRKQKIIISIAGIVLVSLILISLTYAYFLTQITGNTNTKSISVSTANLELVYGDGTTQILKNDTPLEPSSDAIGTKDFTVTNNGNSKTSYVVVIEDVVIKSTTDDTTTTFNSNDFRYTLTCTKKDGTTCDGVTTQSIFPITGGIMVGNNIDVDDVQSYVLTLWYIDTGIDQSNDMGKSLQAKINIKDITQLINPYSINKNSLSYNIIENAKNKTNGTELLSNPKSKVAEEKSTKWGTGKYGTETVATGSLCNEYNEWLVGDSETSAQDGSSVSSYNEAVGKYVYDQCSEWTKYLESYDESTSTLKFIAEIYNYEKDMSVAPDDYGTSYYYRGNVIDNYVNFAGMCWRVVRISGDGSIKLILEDQDNTCATSDGNWDISTTTGGSTKTGNFGYTNYAKNTLTASDGTQNSKEVTIIDYLNSKTNNDVSMATAFKNFQTGPLANYLSYLKIGDWCLNDKAYGIEDNGFTLLTSTEISDNQIKRIYFRYDTYVRLLENETRVATLKCNGTVMNKFNDNTDMYVGTLTGDEVVYAGGIVMEDENPFYYLINNYQKTNSVSFWTLSPYDNGGNVENHFEIYSLAVDWLGGIFGAEVNDNEYFSFRPAVQLKADTQISGGNGTKDNPYIIS